MKLSDTLTGEKTEFTPQDDVVRIYVCGVTPYSDSHLGHAMSYIIFDVLRRYLEYRGYTVRHVQNFTDIDDRIIARAHEQGTAPIALAERFIQRYVEDMAALGVRPPHVYPRATEEVSEMLTIISALIEKGFAYPTPGGDVYYRVRRLPRYGELSHRDVDDLLSGARVEPGAEKEDPLDFALWKAAKPGEPSWDSLWGRGRPGWHIECTAMSLKYLGDPIDIHGGGHDLIFPHHENEIAQSEAFTGRHPFVRYWLHNGWLQMGGEKMSKSLGNIVSIRAGVARYGSDGLRAFVLGSHYRNPLTFSEAILEGASRGIERLAVAANVSGPAEAADNVDAPAFRARFLEAMDDDLNTPQALAALHDLSREINRGQTEGRGIGEAQSTLRELADVLGLRLAPVGAADGTIEAAPFIELLLHLRTELRAAKLFQQADHLRDRLAELGITVEDRADGATWKRERG